MKKTLYFIQGRYKKSLACFGLFILTSAFTVGQKIAKLNYNDIFGQKYSEASGYLSANSTLTKALLINNINPCFAKAIIFPEVLRYSHLRDKMEIQGLLTLYVQYGEEYANFSVGRFQIKPSFAEEVEKDILNNPEFSNSKNLVGLNISNSSEARLARVKRLEKDDWQIQYLIWFIKLTDNKFKNIRWNSEEEKVRFYAAAYNCGYKNSLSYIKEMMNKALFHTTILKGEILYNYSSISHYYWQNCGN